MVHFGKPTVAPGAVLEENIWGNAKKLTIFLAELLNEPLRPFKTPPPYNCLQVLVLHTAVVTKTFRGKAQVWGNCPPALT